MGGILRQDFVGEKTNILYPCLTGFFQNLFDPAVLYASIGSDIDFPIRSISYALLS